MKKLRPLLHLLLLLQGALTSESSVPTNVGKKFMVAFLENIAYYHPDPPKNQVYITSLHNNTNVSINLQISKTKTVSMASGQTKIFDINSEMELGRETKSKKMVTIRSNKDIAVHAVSMRNNSIQMALVAPTDKLVNKYFVPAAPRTSDASAVTERSPFRVIVLTEEENTVTINETYDLSANELVNVQLDNGPQTVRADKPVAVFFGHPCVFRDGCVCGQLYVMLPPANNDTVKFLVPPIVAEGGESSALVLVSDKSASSKSYSKAQPVVQVSGPVFLYHRGLLLSLIPESDFASCYVVSSLLKLSAYVVILVQWNQVDGVRAGTSPLEQVDWELLKTTTYMATRYNLTASRTIIWHTYSKMAVYFIAENGGSLFGHPAPAVSTIPDFRGCILKSEDVTIEDKALSWRESVRHCELKVPPQNLLHVSSPAHMNQVLNQVSQKKNKNLKEVWIGMRRSALNGQWYWVNGIDVGVTNWADREPGPVEEGQCAMMSLEDGEDLKWKDEDCCKTARPVCMGTAILIPLLSD